MYYFVTTRYAPQPKWQKDAVAAYLSSQSANLPPASFFNASGRGFPDIAAIGHNFLITVSGAVQPVGGTSVSAPVVASLFAMLNQVYKNQTNNNNNVMSGLGGIVCVSHSI